MTTAISSGDVIEFTYEGETTTALVLLASADTVILDTCDGSTPVVLPLEDLLDVRVFQPLALAA
jgi:hypothetical protein